MRVAACGCDCDGREGMISIVKDDSDDACISDAWQGREDVWRKQGEEQEAVVLKFG